MTTTIEIGAEYDEKTFNALRSVLAGEGAELVNQVWGVAGSQEVSTWNVKIENEEVEIKAETYIGLTMTGSAELVSRLAASIEATKAEIANE